MKLAVGFITYSKNTVEYLPYFLHSVKEQNFYDYQIMIIDNSEKQENKHSKFLSAKYARINIKWAGGNIGFARAYNKMIKKAAELGAEYFLAVNPDTILEKDAFKKMVDELDRDQNLGSVSPKILQWNFKENKKTGIIDTCGIALRPGLRFIDIGQGEPDKGQYDNIKILGPSGACAMYRISALEKIKQNNQYFDELMFMYKEDCDLAYRLYLAGFKSKLVSKSLIYHDRTTKGRGEGNLRVAFNRKNKSRLIRKWSFLNQQIIFIKYWHLQNLKNKTAVFLYEIKIIIFVLFFEHYLWEQFNSLLKIKHLIKIYRR